MALGGLLLRSGATFLYFLEFLGTAVILGIFSYFLAKNHEASLPIAIWMRVVEGIAGAATLYTLLAVLLTFFLGGITAFAFLAIVLDILFIGAFIAAAYYTRGGARPCGGLTDEDFFGNGVTGIGNTSATPGQICDLLKTCFIIACVLCGLFLLSAILQLWVGRHHRREKRYGPGPSNDYTSGSAKKRGFFAHTPKRTALDTEPVDTHTHATRDVELGTAAAGAGVAMTADMRPSADTAVTDTAYGGPENKYFNEPHRTASTGYAEPATRNHLEQNLQRGSDFQAQPAYNNNNAIHLEPAVHSNSRYEAEKYREELY